MTKTINGELSPFIVFLFYIKQIFVRQKLHEYGILVENIKILQNFIKIT